MNQLLHTPIHRISLRVKASGGIRWSSYVGDVRCTGNNTLSNDNNNFKNNNGHYRNISKRSTPPSPSWHAQTRSISTNMRHSSTTTLRKQSTNRAEVPHERLLVLGSGVAGCATALTAARHGIPVTVLHAGSDKEDCNSYWAQGGVIYRNYRLRLEEEERKKAGDGAPHLVDTPLSLVNDIRIASGYTSPLQRTDPIEECTYSSNLFQNNMRNTPKMGQVCPTSGVHWNEDAAWKLACEGPSRVRELLLGSKDDGLGESHGCVVPFDRTTLPTSGEDDDNDALKGIKDGSEDDVLSLCLEASHAAPRIIHYADCTGKVITQSITKAAFEHPLIEFVGDAVVTDLIMDENGSSATTVGEKSNNDAMVIGAQVLNKTTNQLDDFYAVHGVVLASGGLAGIYQHSTNPLGFNALGSSVGLALRLEDHVSSSSLSGSNNQRNGIVSDLEYVQFHPTALYLPNEARFLLTEALRGEGAILRDAEGRAFAKDYHPNGELAPRDIVARAVFLENQKTAASGGEHNAYLDITHRDSTWLMDRFPSIHAHLQSRDTPMDFTKERIPAIPAAHYTCGGVTTDLNGCVVGDINGSYRNLYAAGEAARTGLHGGNRLASTSLLEGLVFGASVGEMVAGVADDCNDQVALEGREKVMETMHHARHAIEQRLVMGQQQQSSRSNGSNSSQEAVAILAHLKSLMWDNVGVVRTPSNLAVAVSELSAIRDEADRLWKDENNGSNAGWEVAALRDAAHAGLAVADAALSNRVSGGAHYVVLEEEEEKKRGGNAAAVTEQDSDDEDDSFVAVRA